MSAISAGTSASPRDGAGNEIVLEGGRRIAESEAVYLAPVEPSKIVAVHLSRSRIDEYRARAPDDASYFLKPPTLSAGTAASSAGPGQVPELRRRAGGGGGPEK